MTQPSPRESSLPGAFHEQQLDERLRRALEAKGDGYLPRTKHLLQDGSPRYTNRLILESSPYLLQHAHNPVDWYPWGEDAFRLARRLHRPIFVSIGYSTCHWCHVMERESFEDEEIARYLNMHFVAIKVDREERPDVDAQYMTAVQLLTGGGGWPMTVLMTPEKQPFFGGTYFPPHDGARGARLGLLSILKHLVEIYETSPQRIVEQARLVSQRVELASTPEPRDGLPTSAAIIEATMDATARFDPEWGGFGLAPKFPRPVLLELLLRHHRRTGEAASRDMVLRTLEAMMQGGIFDHVAGGFHRYSTDAEWLVPHFEKMLYDNAQLVPSYLEAYQLSRNGAFAHVARETLGYVAREMTAPGGAFYSATDADSRGADDSESEGYFFTWTIEELQSLLGREAAGPVADYFGVTARGNFEGRNILTARRSLEVCAAELGLASDELGRLVESAKASLYRARKGRSAPLRDDKILTSWNGLMISAFARAALVLNDGAFLQRGEAAGDFLWEHLRRSDGCLLRSYNEERAKQLGFLDDYAFLIQGYLDLFEASSHARWLRRALVLQAKLDAGFWDAKEGGYFMTSEAHEALLTRSKDCYDGAEPSGNSVAALNLLRLGELTDEYEFRKQAEALISCFAHTLTKAPGASPKMLSALDSLLDRPREIFVIHPRTAALGAQHSNPLLEPFRRAYVPNRTFISVAEGPELEELAGLVPSLQGKRAIAGVTTAFVCERGRCEVPTSDPALFEKQIATVVPLPVQAAPIASAPSHLH